MQDFAIGQRWVSAGELQLGLGLVLNVEFRTVSIIFPATGETRVYAKQSAPLARVRFASGDTIFDQEDRELKVLQAETVDDLMVYHCRDREGNPVRLGEGRLNNFLKLNHPLQRLLNGQIDKNQQFELRAKTQKVTSFLGRTDLVGLSGCRTLLIDHQLYIAHEVATRFAPRVLLADEVGLGKTIEAGLIMQQRLLSERAQRVLIVVPESLQHQWLLEMMRRFNLLFSIFDEERCEALEGEDGAHAETYLPNPFHSEQLVLCSLQFLVEDERRFQQSLEGDWDMLIVDEAHHLVWREGDPSPEYRLVEQLAKKIPSVLLLTATPEQLGKESHFARLRLLDPDRFSDLAHFVADETGYQQIADLVDVLLQDRTPDTAQMALLAETIAEGDNQARIDHIDDPDPERARDAREQLVEHLLDRHGVGRLLFRNTRHAVEGFPARHLSAHSLECPEPYREMYRHLTAQDSDSIDLQWLLSPEIAWSETAAQNQAWTAVDPRVGWLLELFEQLRGDKILVICHRAESALDLVQAIRARSGTGVTAFHEGLSLIERDRAAAWFADPEQGAQALVCSEIGSEGRNFQFAAHLVMFDLPLDPDLLEQRIGRLDRIGQRFDITIHAPYLTGTGQEVMLHWLHQGLNAFEQTCPAGHSVFKRSYQELQQALCDPAKDLSDFYQRSAQLHAELNRELQQGRDRLLEYNSCRPQRARALRDSVETAMQQFDLPRYLAELYDVFGINYEIQGPGRWILTPSDNMPAQIPGLPGEGMTVTYDRDVALSNEDVRFLTWTHPLVRALMERVVSGEMGNTALIAVKYRGAQPGTLLLDGFFRIDINNVAGVDAARYLENGLLRVCIDESGVSHAAQLSPDFIARAGQRVDADTAVKVVKSRESVIKALLERAEQAAEAEMPQRLEQARESAQQALNHEIERLVALKTFNPNVRDEEIDHFRAQLAQVMTQIEQAKLRLDAIRIMVVI